MKGASAALEQCEAGAESVLCGNSVRDGLELCHSYV